jgi:hypothetical protein
MPVQRINKNQSTVSRAALDQLARKVNLHPGNISWVDPWFVYNPHPNEYRFTWAAQENVRERKRVYGAETVTVEDGKKLYQIPPDDYDKTNNRIVRLGMVLLRYPIEAYEARMALGAYLSVKHTSTDIESFQEEENARILDASGRVVSKKKSANKNGKRLINPTRDAIEEAEEEMEPSKVSKRGWAQHRNAGVKNTRDIEELPGDDDEQGIREVDGVKQIGGDLDDLEGLDDE